jgi:two-component system sensor histidine kinase AlgZ
MQTMDSKDPVASTLPADTPAWAVSTPFAGGPAEAGVAAGHVGRSPEASSPFDVCHVGVVLRVVLGVQVAVGLGVSFAASGGADAIDRWIQSAMVSLPASLLWLVVACGARGVLARLTDWGQWAGACSLGLLVGGLAHWLACWLDHWVTGQPVALGWNFVPPLLTGAALAGVALAWLKQRAHSQLPAHAAARLAELQARIRPHFLFNTLNTAIALVQIDPQRAESVLEDLAELFRQALSSPSLRSTLADEVALARRYLGIEQLRFGDRVTVRWELDEAAAVAEVPALVLQPLVENAVRHGVEANPSGGWIVVRSLVQAGQAVLTVSNSVPTRGPTTATAGHGIALRNVRQRLRLMHDVEADFKAGLQKGEGAQPPIYVVRIAVPMPASSRGVPVA